MGMFDFAKITAIIGLVLQVVQMIEKLLPGLGGKEKKEAALRFTHQTLGEGGAPTDAGTAAIVGRSIDTVVSTLHDIGVFKHKAEKAEKEEKDPKKDKEKKEK